MKLTTLILLIATAFIVHADRAFSQTSEVRGRVTDLFGTPLQNALVKAGSEGQNFQNTKTSVTGEYVVGALSAGKIHLSYSLTGFHNEDVEIYLDGKESKVLDVGLSAGQLTPLPGLKLKGVIKDKLNKAVEDATISVINVFNQTVKTSVSSNKNGKYEIEISQRGIYILQITKPGLEVVAKLIVFDGRETESLRTINLILSVGYPIAQDKFIMSEWPAAGPIPITPTVSGKV